MGRLKESIKKYERGWLAALITLCLALIVAGGVSYVSSLRDGLTQQAIRNVLTVTEQQQQAFDNFITNDRERLHSFAEYYSQVEHSDTEEVLQTLTMFGSVEAVYSVICLDEGWFCSNSSYTMRQLTDEQLSTYLSFTGSGVRDAFDSLFTGTPRFGYYETFTFATGHRGLLQKSYDRTKVIETFSLSFYDDQGLAYVVDQDGDILLHSTSTIDSRVYDNIFDIVAGTHDSRNDTDALQRALASHETGSMIFDGDDGSYVYTHVPIQNVDGWSLVSVVPLSAITEETDQILMNSQRTIGLLFAILAAFMVLALLLRRTQQNMLEKDRELEHQEQLFDIFSTYLSRNTDNIYILLDVEGRQVEYASPNAERVLGVTAGQLMADMHSYKPTYVSEAQKELTVLKLGLKPGMELENIETEWSNPRTGEQKYLLESVYCTQLQGRDKLVVYISDRTQEQKDKDVLQEALKMAREANHAKSAFLGNISHDIRTPMNAIMGLVALLRNDAGNEQLVLEYTARIDAASQHLLGLINDVLDMNKIESGSATLNIGPLNLADIINELNTIIRPQAKARNQVFEIFVSSLSHEQLLGDKVRINQILLNILSNAVKYTPEEGRIQLLAEELPQVIDGYCRIRFVVCDNGQGMSEDYLSVIFDPFTREQTATISKIQGTGLGMAITKSLVDLMGGDIKVDSKPGAGTTFTVELELRIQDQEDDESRFWAEHRIRRIIVADDDVELCAGVTAAMARVGVTADYATNGASAIQMIRTAQERGQPYNLFLLDWKMPGMDGLETARLLLDSYQGSLPILLLTAYDWDEIEAEAREIGVNHFMSKPFFMSNFKEAVSRIMGARPSSPDDDVVRGMHILVVDDIEVNRMILVKILNTLGAECDTAENGRQALEKFQQAPPGSIDLIFMDIQMPVMDGYDATRAIRAGTHPEAKSIPIIAMTANAFVDDVRDALDAGMDAHVAKPIQLDKLKAAVRQVLDDKEAQEIDAQVAQERKES